MAKKLFIPGPTDVREEVYEAMKKPMIGHRTPEFSELYVDTVEKLQDLMFTNKKVFISTSSSTGVMEAAVRNCVKDRCLNVGNGAFSYRWHEITKKNGKDADLLDAGWGNAPTAEAIDKKLSEKDYDALTIVHNETSTGVATPLDEISEVAKDHGVTILVDTVSSMGGMKIEVDKLDLDVCLFGVQKAMALPSGIACFSVSQKAMEKSEEVEDRGYYFDFQVFKKYYNKNQTPTTAAISTLRGLNYQLDYILNEEGLQNRYVRHAKMAEMTRKWVYDKGFELFPEEKYASDTVTCVKNTHGINCKKLKQELADRGYVFSNGYGSLKEKTFRIAHMGDRKPEELRKYLDTIEDLAEL